MPELHIRTIDLRLQRRIPAQHRVPATVQIWRPQPAHAPRERAVQRPLVSVALT